MVPLSPRKLFPALGVTKRVKRWTPALRMNVVPDGLALIAAWMSAPG
jgi:hypothetical protein